MLSGSVFTVWRLTHGEGQLDFGFLESPEAREEAARRGRPPADLDEPQRTLATVEDHISDDEGLLARKIKPHSREKAHNVRRYADTVSIAMAGKFAVWWLELFAGPGRLYDLETQTFLPGSPLDALAVTRPFSGYAFGDKSDECIASLRRRIGERPDVRIEKGNANNRDHIEHLAASIPTDALVIAYLDPEGLDLEFETIRYLAWRYRRLDLVLNVPVHAIDRAISTGRRSAKAAAVLDHPNPAVFLTAGRASHTAIRAHFKQKLRDLGYRYFVANAIRSESRNTPQYDLMLASRSAAAEKLYRGAIDKRPSGQRSLGLAV